MFRISQMPPKYQSKVLSFSLDLKSEAVRMGLAPALGCSVSCSIFFVHMMLMALHMSKESIYYNPNRCILCSPLKSLCFSIASDVL